MVTVIIHTIAVAKLGKKQVQYPSIKMRIWINVVLGERKLLVVVVDGQPAFLDKRKGVACHRVLQQIGAEGEGCVRFGAENRYVSLTRFYITE